MTNHNSTSRIQLAINRFHTDTLLQQSLAIINSLQKHALPPDPEIASGFDVDHTTVLNLLWATETLLKDALNASSWRQES